MSPESLRLHVRHSQLYDFVDCGEDLKHMFLRWMLSEPLPEPKHPTDLGSASSPPRHYPSHELVSALTITQRACGIEQKLELPHRVGASETTGVMAA